MVGGVCLLMLPGNVVAVMTCDVTRVRIVIFMHVLVIVVVVCVMFFLHGLDRATDVSHMCICSSGVWLVLLLLSVCGLF